MEASLCAHDASPRVRPHVHPVHRASHSHQGCCGAAGTTISVGKSHLDVSMTSLLAVRAIT